MMLFFLKKKTSPQIKHFKESQKKKCFEESTVVLLKLGKFQNLAENWIFLSFICGYFYIENENRRPVILLVILASLNSCEFSIETSAKSYFPCKVSPVNGQKDTYRHVVAVGKGRKGRINYSI